MNIDRNRQKKKKEKERKIHSILIERACALSVALQRYLLPWRAAAHHPDGVHLQGLENVRRHEDEIPAERNVAPVPGVYGTKRSHADEASDRAVRQRHVRPGGVRVRGLGPGRLGHSAQVPRQNPRRRSTKVRRRSERYLEDAGPKDEGRRSNQRGSVFDHLRAESGDRSWRSFPRVLLLGLVLDREGAAALGDVQHRERNVVELRLGGGQDRLHPERW